MTDAAPASPNMSGGGAHAFNGAANPPPSKGASVLSVNGRLALHLAAHGFYVFPCRSSDVPELDKKPVMVAHWKEESSRDPATIRRWWRRNETALVAIDCGKSSLVVVDADRHPNAPDGVATLKGIVGDDLLALGCPIVETPGNGLHLYFRQPDDGEAFRNVEGALNGRGINMRGAGGYVIAPGSVRHDGLSYRGMEDTPDLGEALANGSLPQVPAVIADLIRSPKAKPEDAPQWEAGAPQTKHESAGENDRLRSYALAALERNAADLAACGKGGRNILLNSVALRAGRMAARGWLTKQEASSAFHQACVANNYTKDKGPKSFRDTFESGFRAGLRRPLPDPVDREYPGDAFAEAFGAQDAGAADEQPKSAAREAPRPLFRPLPPAPAYPVDALGDVLALAARAIVDKVQCPAALAAQSVLGAASLAVQAHADVEIPATRHTKPLSLYLISVAASGERKSAADSEALWPIRKREKALRETYNADLKDFLKARKAWEAASKKSTAGPKDDYGATKSKLDALGDEPAPPLMPMLICGEPTFEGLCKLLADGQPAMGVFSDEGGAFINGHGMSPDNRLRTVAGLSGVWDGSPIKRVRVLDGSSIIAGKRVSLHLMAQPDAAALLLTDPVLQDQGFLSRLLVAAPTSTAGARFQRDPDPASSAALSRYHARILSILECAPRLEPDTRNELDPHVLTFAPHAAQVWREFADHVEKLLAPGQLFEPIRGFANKLPEHAARIAAVLTLVDDIQATHIVSETFERAVRLAEYYAQEALRLFGAGYANPELRRAEALRNWLLSSWGEPLVSVRAIVRLGPNSIRDTATAKAAIKVLVDHDWLVPHVGKAMVEGQNVRQAWSIIREGSE